ncbi:TIGR03086 family metal-binding protein [Kitasatospora sp. NPDC048540]|uniref:TIGR03086 family metal-binding protein n=1 Tax=unclassified Kitasatospora TaxID=2633591 RepID=UPI00053B5188|nr:TIGR03086 family metal-binding protein [Kitasatospora sp. MBT63]
MLELHRLAMRHSVAAVDRIRDGQWELPTPCADWDVRRLVEHMTAENLGFAAAADGEREDRGVWEYRATGAGPVADYRASAKRVVEAFGAPGVLDGRFWLPRINDARTFPARQAVSYHLLDYLVHSWDVAVAIGAPVDFEPELVAEVAVIAEREVPDTPRRLRPGAGFRPALPVPGTVPPLERLLAALGRSARWPQQSRD